MRVTQGCFSFLPDLNDQQIEAMVSYAIDKGWAMNVEWTDDPHPRNSYWDLWGLPLFDVKDPATHLARIWPPTRDSEATTDSDTYLESAGPCH